MAPPGLNYVGYLGQGEDGGGELEQTARSRREQGSGDHFKPRPGWPSRGLLEYVQKFATAALLLLGLLMFVVHGIANPAGALRLLVAGAKRQVGI